MSISKIGYLTLTVVVVPSRSVFQMSSNINFDSMTAPRVALHGERERFGHDGLRRGGRRGPVSRRLWQVVRLHLKVQSTPSSNDRKRQKANGEGGVSLQVRHSPADRRKTARTSPRACARRPPNGPSPGRKFRWCRGTFAIH